MRRSRRGCGRCWTKRGGILDHFLLACAGLVLLSGVFYLFPRLRSGLTEDELDRVNLEWFRLRRADWPRRAMTRCGKMLTCDCSRTATARRARDRCVAVVPGVGVVAVVALLASGLYYLLGSAPDVELARQLRAMNENTPPEQMRSLIGAVEVRSQQRPDNLHYLALLGRYYMGLEDYARAKQTYDALADAVPGDAQALAYAAQAEYLARVAHSVIAPGFARNRRWPRIHTSEPRWVCWAWRRSNSNSTAPPSSTGSGCWRWSLRTPRVGR